MFPDRRNMVEQSTHPSLLTEARETGYGGGYLSSENDKNWGEDQI